MPEVKKHGRRGPKPGAPNAGRPAPDGPRVNLSCRVRPETLAALRAMGPLGEAIDRLVSGK